MIEPWLGRPFRGWLARRLPISSRSRRGAVLCHPGGLGWGKERGVKGRPGDGWPTQTLGFAGPTRSGADRKRDSRTLRIRSEFPKCAFAQLAVLLGDNDGAQHW